MSISSYRSNVCIVIIKDGKVLLFERNGNDDNWQFPQGGIDSGEDTEAAMWRELHEETGLEKSHCVIKAHTQDFLFYDIPAQFITGKGSEGFKGQKQMWFLVELLASEQYIKLDIMPKPEFQSWVWASYWSGINKSVSFKREAYRQALVELLPVALKLNI